MVPPRQVLETCGPNHTSTVHRWLRGPTSCAGPAFIVVRPRSNDRLRILDRVRIGLKTKVPRKNGS